MTKYCSRIITRWLYQSQSKGDCVSYNGERLKTGLVNVTLGHGFKSEIGKVTFLDYNSQNLTACQTCIRLQRPTRNICSQASWLLGQFLVFATGPKQRIRNRSKWLRKKVTIMFSAPPLFLRSCFLLRIHSIL